MKKFQQSIDNGETCVHILYEEDKTSIEISHYSFGLSGINIPHELLDAFCDIIARVRGLVDSKRMMEASYKYQTPMKGYADFTSPFSNLGQQEAIKTNDAQKSAEAKE
jgi:hypothetical protein